MLRAGVIGVGSFGVLHAEAYRDNPLTELVAVADIDIGRVSEVASKLGVRSYSDFHDMLRREKLDVVSVATPDDKHTEPAVAATEAGVNILLEKPIATDLQEAKKIIAAVEKNNVKLMVNFILRFDPRYRRAYELVSEREIGEIVTIWARRSTLLETAKKYGKFSNLLYDVIIHDIDMCNLFTMSEPKKVYCVGVKKVLEKTGLEDAYLAIIQYSGGSAAALETSWVLPSTSPHWLDSRFHVIGTEGAVYVDLQSHGLEIVSSKGVFRPDLSNWPKVGGRLVGNLREAVNYFAECVIKDVSPSPSATDGLKALEVASALFRSASIGQPIELG
uniref:Oxidoreductase NAD-binding protein n=1 Tax=Caldiarchaeum subterraneum TaxID=311458 RepID=E6N3R5_CALS0|nr:oxidoreductase NAD-binding protein [Candidatus Caldarchaeum subterraneum]